MKKIVLLTLLISTSAWGEASLCTKSEVTYFACHTEKETISVCSSKSFGYLQYRVGNENGIYFEYPSKKENSINKFRYSEMRTGYGWGETHLSFSNKEKIYVLIDGWFNRTPPAEGINYDRKILILNKDGIPKAGEEDVYKMDLLNKKYTCKKSVGRLIEIPPGQVENEEFVYQ